MLFETKKSRISCVMSVAALALASCAAQTSPQTGPVVESTSTGKVLTGTVAAARNFNITSSNSSALQGIFSALQQGQPPATVSGTEYVVQLNDGNTLATGQSPADATLKTGDHVTVVQTSRTVLLQRN